MQRCCALIHYLLVIVGICAGRGGGGLFALITHKRKANVYILNTLIPWSTSPLPCSLPAPGALITVGNDAVILRGGRRVGELEQVADSEWDRNRERERSRGRRQIRGGIYFPLLLPLGLFSPSSLSSLLINLWNITVSFWAHIAVFYAQRMRLLLNALWSSVG